MVLYEDLETEEIKIIAEYSDLPRAFKKPPQQPDRKRRNRSKIKPDPASDHSPHEK